MTTRRRSRLLTKITISPRRHRELEAAFCADMRALRCQLNKPHPRETWEQFVERLFEQLEATLARYDNLGMRGLMLRKPAQRGRRPSLVKEPKQRPGRPRDPNAEHVARIVSRDGRPIPDAAREVLREDWKKHDRRRSNALMELAEDHRDHATYTLSPSRALTGTVSRFVRTACPASRAA